MKRKILRISIALVLVVSFSLMTAVPAAAGSPAIALTTVGGGIDSLSGTPTTSGTEAGVHSIEVIDATVSTLTGAVCEGTTDGDLADPLESGETLTLTIGGTQITTGALAASTTLAAAATDIETLINTATTAPDVNVTVVEVNPTTAVDDGYLLITVVEAGVSNSITGQVTGTGDGETETGLALIDAVAGTDASAVDTFTAATGSNGLWVADGSYGNSTNTMTIAHTTTAPAVSDFTGLKSLVTPANAFINGITLAASGALSAGTAVVTVSEGTAGYLAVTGTATMNAGTANELTVTAYDDAANLATLYTGSKTLVFSGPGVAPDATAPTVESVTMENETAVTFTAGVSSGTDATLIAYKAETVEVEVSDGTIDSTADAAYDLDLTVAPLAAAQLAYSAAPTSVDAGVEASVFTVERQDQYDNPTTLGGALVVTPASTSDGAAKEFRATSSGAAVTTVEIADSASAADFYYYDEKAGAWTITASAGSLTAATAVLTVNPDIIDHYSVTAIASPQTIGAAFSVTIQAQDAFDNNITAGPEEDVNIAVTAGGSVDPTTTGTTVAGAATVGVSLSAITLGQSITFTGATSFEVGTSNPFQTVTYGAIDHYVVTTTIGDQKAGVNFEIIIQAQNASNNDITLGTDASEAITITFGLTDANAAWTPPTTSAGTATVSNMNMSVAQTGQTIIVTGASGKFGTSNSFTVYDDIVNYPYDGWTLTSTDKWIDTTGSAWIDTPVQFLKYTDADGFLDATLAANDLKPVEALYVQMDGTDKKLGIIYSTDVQGMSEKDLVAGWNLISSATSTANNADDVLSPLQDVASAGTGLTTLVSQATYNRNTADLYIDTTTWGNLSTTTLNAFDGYWIYMNAVKSFGVIPD